MQSDHIKLCQVAIFNTRLSVKNFRAAMGVPAALGLDPVMANSGRSGLDGEDFFLFLLFPAFRSSSSFSCSIEVLIFPFK